MEKVDQFLAKEKANITMKNAKIQNYKISVSLIKQDFPKQILNEKSEILPLPLSTQNEASFQGLPAYLRNMQKNLTFLLWKQIVI